MAEAIESRRLDEAMDALIALWVAEGGRLRRIVPSVLSMRLDALVEAAAALDQAAEAVLSRLYGEEA